MSLQNGSFFSLYAADAHQDFYMRISAYAHHPHEPHGSASSSPSLVLAHVMMLPSVMVLACVMMLPRVVVLAHVMMLTRVMALAAVMVLANIMVLVNVIVLVNVMVFSDAPRGG